jgi:hypothetical protein
MNKKLIIILSLSASLFSSCGWFSGDTECEKLIDRRTMANLLTDVFILEAKITNQPPTSGIRDSVVNYYAGIFEKYNITAAQFEKAFECYLMDSKNMNWVMDEVLTALSLSQSKINERKEEPGL